MVNLPHRKGCCHVFPDHSFWLDHQESCFGKLLCFLFRHSLACLTSSVWTTFRIFFGAAVQIMVLGEKYHPNHKMVVSGFGHRMKYGIVISIVI